MMVEDKDVISSRVQKLDAQSLERLRNKTLSNLQKEMDKMVGFKKLLTLEPETIAKNQLEKIKQECDYDDEFEAKCHLNLMGISNEMLTDHFKFIKEKIVKCDQRIGRLLKSLEQLGFTLEPNIREFANIA